MAYVHNIDPFAIQLNWNIFGFHLDGIRWYGLAYLAGFVCAYLIMQYYSKRKLILLNEEQIGDFTTYGALGVLVGGRVGYALFYSPDLILDLHSSFPFWGVLEVHKGGMASHGGILGVMVAAWLFSRKHKIPMWHLLDLTVIAGALAFFFGRIANFINGELYGRECAADFRWAVKFPQEVFRWLRDAASSSFDEKAIALQKLKGFGPAVEQFSPITLPNNDVLKANAAEWSNWIDRLGQPGLANTDTKIYQFFDWMIESIQSGNAKLAEIVAPALTPRYPSQLFQSAMEGFLVFAILVVIWLKPRKPGIIASWFGVLYAFMRIIGEQFRMPDAQIGFEALGLTRGQWLSVAQLVAGIALVIYFSRREAPKYGGFLVGKSAK